MSAHRLAKLGVQWSNLHQDEVGMAGEVADSKLAKSSHRALTAGGHLIGIPADVGVVFERDRQAFKREAIHIVGRADLADVVHQVGIAGQHAEPQVSKAICLREGSTYYEIRSRGNVGEGRVAVEVVVGFIDKYNGVWRGGCNGEEMLARDDATGRVVRRGDHDELWSSA